MAVKGLRAKRESDQKATRVAFLENVVEKREHECLPASDNRTGIGGLVTRDGERSCE